MEKNGIVISDSALREGAEKGMDAFLQVFIDAYLKVMEGEGFDAEKMHRLNGWQHALLSYHFFRREVLEGGFVQLIQNGFGPYIYDNPFAKAMRLMGLKEFAKMIYATKEIYDEHRADLEKDCTEEEFMAMYEQYEAFDDFEDEFISEEEEITEQIARYVDGHIGDFAEISQDDGE